MNKLKVLFVWPKYEDEMLGPPLGFAYLISNCRSDKFDFELIDCVLDNLESTDSELVQRISLFSPAIVAISATSTNFPEATAILSVVKGLNCGITTILGGPHATAYGREAFENDDIDFMFMGEAELGFKDFLNSFVSSNEKSYPDIIGLAYKDKNGTRHLSVPARIENLDNLVPPDYDAINIERYIDKGYNYLSNKERCAPIYCTRGCPYKCKFCSVPSISGRIVRKHSVPYLIEMVRFLYEEKGIRGFNVVDDNFTFDVDFAKKFCREIIELDLQDTEFNSPNGIRMQRGDSELWTLMKQAGWNSITVAPESGSSKVLQMMKKDLDPSIVPRVVSDIKRAGLRVYGFFIIGFPGETVADLQETEKLIRLCHFDNIFISFFQPIPGTPIYDELVASGELFDDHLPCYFDRVNNHFYEQASLNEVDLHEVLLRVTTLFSYAHSIDLLSSDEELARLNKIFIVGAGNFSFRAINKFKKLGIPVAGVVEEDLEVDKIHDLPVFSTKLGSLQSRNIDNALFLVAISIDQYRSATIDRLVSAGVAPHRVLYFKSSLFEDVFDNEFQIFLEKFRSHSCLQH